MFFGSNKQAEAEEPLDCSPRRFTEYKVVRFNESGIATLLLGSSMLPIGAMEDELNDLAEDGWQVICQVVEKQRFLLFWERDSVIVTLGR